MIDLEQGAVKSIWLEVFHITNYRKPCYRKSSSLSNWVDFFNDQLVEAISYVTRVNNP